VKHFSALENGSMTGAALVLFKELPVIKKRIYCIPRGPVAENSNGETLEFMLARIGKYVRENGGFFVRADPYLEETDEHDLVFEQCGYRKLAKKWSYWNCPKFVFWLGLEDGIGAVYDKMKRKNRWEIRSAEKKGIRIVRGEREDLRDFYDLMLETASRKNIGVHDFGYYDSIMETIEGQICSQLFLARCKAWVWDG